MKEFGAGSGAEGVEALLQPASPVRREASTARVGLTRPIPP